MTGWALFLTYAFAQEAGDVSSGERALILGGFAAAVAAIALFLARDIIFRRKTRYDSEDLDSKRDRTYEKYHSDWGDDYEEMGGRTRSTRYDGEPDHYSVLGVDRDATHDEIKARFRELAKRAHPDRTGDDSDEMARINRAYEVLSDERDRKRYDQARG